MELKKFNGLLGVWDFSITGYLAPFSQWLVQEITLMIQSECLCES